MAIDLGILNFRNIRDARIRDERKVSVFVGNNEAGKTSLIGCIRWVLTGEAYGCKGKDGIADLVTYGETRISGDLHLGRSSFTRTRSSGDAIKTVAERFGVLPELLPLLLDARLNGDGGNKHMRAFLDGSAEAQFDPLVACAGEAEVRVCLEAARDAGKRKTKDIIAFCEAKRAGSKAPPQPVQPSMAEPREGLVTEAKKQAEATSAREREEAGHVHEYVQFNRGLVLVGEYLAALARYTTESAACAKGDPLGNLRLPYTKLSALQDHTIVAVADYLKAAAYHRESAGVTEALALIRSAQADARRRLLESPAPPHSPVSPQLPDEAQLAFAELKSRDMLSEVGVRTALAGSSNVSSALRAKLADAQAANVRASADYDTIMQAVGAWTAYRNAVPVWEERTAAATAEWNRWDHAAVVIKTAETDHINRAGLSFGALVSNLGSVLLQGRQIRISRDEGIFLGKDPIEQCSESARWRMEVAVMTAVGITLKSPLLLIDGADILDPVNTTALATFLNDHAVPHFQHIIINRTPRGPMEEEYQSPGTLMTKWLVVNGTIKRASDRPTESATMLS